MKIKEVTISNWRSINSVTIKFENLMLLIGQNNHGKSNILSSLLFFFGDIKTQELDFHNNAEELFVEILFGNLNENSNDLTNLSKYISNEKTIKVRRSAYRSGTTEYRGYIQSPEEQWLQEQNAGSYTNRKAANELPFAKYLPKTGRLTKAHVIAAQNEYTEKNIDKVDFNYELESSNFLGLKSLPKGIFGQTYYIPAIRNASDDYLSKETSAFGALYSKVVEKMSASNSEWRGAKQNISNLFSLLNKTDVDGKENAKRPKELTKFEEKLSSQLGNWDAEIDVEITPPNIDEVFKANTQVWVNDGVKTDIRRKGHGLQRALSFALIKTISETSKEEQSKSVKKEVKGKKASDSMYFILEEPELYLHPQAQRSLFDSLIDLTKLGSQVILCTHSSALIDLEYYKSICIVKKESSLEGTTIYQCTEDLFAGNKKKDFNLSYWINPDRSELFFAKKVLLVEGTTEKTIIPYLAQQIGVFKHDYTMIDCGSKTTIPSYCSLLNKFNIPYTVIYDLDHQSEKNKQAIAVADRATALIEETIDKNLGSTIVLENDIEEEMGLSAESKNKPYVALESINTKSFNLKDSFRKKILMMYQ